MASAGRWVSRVSRTEAVANTCVLHAAASQRRCAAAVRAALAADPAAAREQDADGWLPLHVAAYAAAASSQRPDVAADAVQALDMLLALHPAAAATPERTHSWLPLHLAAISRSPPPVLHRLLRAHPGGASTRDSQGYTPAQHAAIHGAEAAVLRTLCEGDCPAHRAVSLAALERFADAHDAWRMPTWQVVRDVVAPATARPNGSEPARYASLLPADDVGLADVFVSHAWASPFGLLVAAARAFADRAPAPAYPNEARRREREVAAGERRYPKPAAQLRFWVDIFAVAQHASARQASDLSWLAPVVRAAPLGTLLAAEAPTAPPLRRAWCLYELAVTLQGPLPAGPLWEQGDV